MNERAQVPALMVGGAISAIIPQSIEETWRLATMIVEAGLAPQALVGREPADDAGDDAWKRWGKKGTSAVAIVIMSGAELGLPPMVSLRSFTVIGGKPALYGDGLINVVRKSGRAKSLELGYFKDASKEALLRLGLSEDMVAGMNTVDERTIGWCKAVRADTGEMKVVAYSVADAKQAGLWDERPTRRGTTWIDGKKVWGDVPNDSSWFRHPKRMKQWRAAGFCLRELFGDVLGGVRDEFEAREIARDLIEHDEDEPAPKARLTPPSPPPVPSLDAIDPIPDNGFDKDVEGMHDGAEAAEEEKPEAFDYGKFFEDFQIALQGAKSAAAVEEIWTEFDVEAQFHDDESSRALADKIKARRLAALIPPSAG
ncbi:hypothetical protein [Mesorhizobium sp. M2A.F.Ca.ET.067.02.1.1]|uniref:hypothetical protein n=1 Tax=Mesorhizobium sp. M2A.F.Ca.ET.067.02.1.1 TaxID=2496749 RepID=UPI000FD22834|nr:hypothetical protein [Mesorhizobium sp. M2A.F.Ca.ET.067.02.1.1]RUW81523.1 hypothetical protein EOA28_00945 [Mesorhizobium sp. M2A.F.Ca.ET.067.02.1.1]TIU49195.1 MAG: hypothetical protein E5W35_33125 [Mesorhizobium sp.]